MKAAVFDQFGEPSEVLQIRDVDRPDPKHGQVRVRMLASPVNPSDVMVIRGQYGRLPELPATPGFEGVGVIDAVGKGFLAKVRRLSPGKRVAVLNGHGGNWQEYVVLSAKNVVPIGDMPDAQAATFFVNPATAWVMTQEVLQVPQGEWLLQTAAGSALGKMVQRLGEKQGFRVINVVRREEQADEMRKAGMTALSGDEDSIPEQVRNLTAGKGVRYAIDAVGGQTAIDAVKSLTPGGKLLVYGTLANEPMSLDQRILMTGQTCIQGFWLSEWVKEQGILKMLSLFRKIRGLIEEGTFTTEVEEFVLENIREAVVQSEAKGKDKKVLLRIGN